MGISDPLRHCVSLLVAWDHACAHAMAPLRLPYDIHYATQLQIDGCIVGVATAAAAAAAAVAGRKPIHRAFQLLHTAGSKRLAVTEATGGTCSTTSVLALVNTTGSANTPMTETATSGAMIFVSNGGRAGCNVSLTALPLAEQLNPDSHATTAWLHRIDDTHGNPLSVWKAQGSPPFPTLKQTAELRLASEIHASSLTLGGNKDVEVYVPPNSLVVLVV